MSGWSLEKMLANLHEDIQRRLQAVRETIGHNGTMGDGSENVWLELLRKYLPERYAVEKAFVVDSKDSMSQQIDVVIFDRQYTPFIFVIENQKVVPAESVYAVFEAKQAIDAGMIDYAQKKVASVRRLHRTSLPIPHAGGTFPAKPPIDVLGGILTFESDWSPAMGEPLSKALTHQLRPSPPWAASTWSAWQGLPIWHPTSSRPSLRAASQNHSPRARCSGSRISRSAGLINARCWGSRPARPDTGCHRSQTAPSNEKPENGGSETRGEIAPIWKTVGSLLAALQAAASRKARRTRGFLG
ncbi:MAG: hypothetical protein IPF48_07885 [Sphingomonadales bacterium]|nr:hypothetical protein [Sphingomonadales bacterium]